MLDRFQPDLLLNSTIAGNTKPGLEAWWIHGDDALGWPRSEERDRGATSRAGASEYVRRSACCEKWQRWRVWKPGARLDAYGNAARLALYGNACESSRRSNHCDQTAAIGPLPPGIVMSLSRKPRAPPRKIRLVHLVEHAVVLSIREEIISRERHLGDPPDTTCDYSFSTCFVSLFALPFFLPGKMERSTRDVVSFILRLSSVLSFACFLTFLADLSWDWRSYFCWRKFTFVVVSFYLTRDDLWFSILFYLELKISWLFDEHER